MTQALHKLPISVSMISGPEAQRIGQALTSVGDWASEIVVVLNADARDGTEEIALKHGAKVFREPWKGYVSQKASAANKSTQEWVLGLDADEAVSPELRSELYQLFAGSDLREKFAAFSCPRLTMFCGRWIRHGDWYPDRTVRLWRRGQAEWAGIDPHDSLSVRGSVGKLRGNLLHYNAETIDRQISKIPSFSNYFVQHMQASGRKAAWWDLAFRPLWRFGRGYFLRLGFLDGWQGYYIAWMAAFHTVTRYAKVRGGQLPQ